MESAARRGRGSHASRGRKEWRGRGRPYKKTSKRGTPSEHELSDGVNGNEGTDVEDTENASENDQEEAVSISRISTPAASGVVQRYQDLKKSREEELAKLVNANIVTEDGPRDFKSASTLIGTCPDMCPEFERLEREIRAEVDTLERLPSNGGPPMMDPARGVKYYRRSAAGDDAPLPSDIRPPHVLSKTLDYLFSQLLVEHPFSRTHGFIRNRTRAVRKDFVYQHEKGPLAIECHERIARYHILALYEMKGQPGYSEQQELEQLRKTLQSLTEFYDDARLSANGTANNYLSPNEAEFRAYHILSHLRDPEVTLSMQRLPESLFDDPSFSHASRLRDLVQRGNEGMREGRSTNRAANSLASLNFFARFFKLVASSRTPFLVAALLQTHFNDIRVGAIKGLKKAFLDAHIPYPIPDLVRILGFDDAKEAANAMKAFGINVEWDQENDEPLEFHLFKYRKSAAPAFQEFPAEAPEHVSWRIVGSKKGNLTYPQILNIPIASADLKINGYADTQRNGSSFVASASSSPATTSKIAIDLSKVKPKLNATAPSFVPRSLSPNSSTLTAPGVSKSPPIASAFSFSATTKPQQSSQSPFEPQLQLQPQPQPQPQPAPPVTASIKQPITKPLLPPVVTSTNGLQLSESSRSLKRAASPLEQSILTKPKLSPSFSPAASIIEPAPSLIQPSKVVEPKPKSQVIAPLIKEYTDQLTDRLIDQVIESISQKIAVDILSEANKEYDATRAALRSDALDEIAEDFGQLLAENVVRTIALDIAAETFQKRSLCLFTKRTLLSVCKRRKKARAEKRKFQEAFGATTKSLGISAPFGYSTRPSGISKRFRIIDQVGLESRNVDEQAANKVKRAQSKVSSLWEPDTILNMFGNYVKQFYPYNEHVQGKWTALVLVNEAVPLSVISWYKRKLGIDMDSTGVSIQANHVLMDMNITKYNELNSEHLENLGLLIVNFTSIDNSNYVQLRRTLEDIEDKGISESAFCPKVIFISWDSDPSALEFYHQMMDDMLKEKNKVGFWQNVTVLKLDEEGPDNLIRESLYSDSNRSIVRNTRRAHRPKARDVVKDLLSVYESFLDELYNLLGRTADEDVVRNGLKTFLECLNIIVEDARMLVPSNCANLMVTFPVFPQEQTLVDDIYSYVNYDVFNGDMEWSNIYGSLTRCRHASEYAQQLLDYSVNRVKCMISKLDVDVSMKAAVRYRTRSGDKVAGKATMDLRNMEMIISKLDFELRSETIQKYPIPIATSLEPQDLNVPETAAACTTTPKRDKKSSLLDLIRDAREMLRG